MDQGLAGHTAIVQAIATEFRRLFNQRDLQPELRRHAGDYQATGTTTNNHQITCFHFLLISRLLLAE